MARNVTVGVAQMGPIQADHRRADVVERQLVLLRDAHEAGCDVVAFPELALTTFFPRWYLEDQRAVDAYFETEMPGPETRVLFDEARRLQIGFVLGYAELTPEGLHHNASILVDRRGRIRHTYRKVHLPGHADYEKWRPFQHLEKRYFDLPAEGFTVGHAFNGTVGMLICNDRRWPESYRELGLQGVEMIFIGYNTPVHNPPAPDHDEHADFHNHLVMQAGAYQNGTWVVGVAKAGDEEGVPMIGGSCIVAPSGRIVVECASLDDELVAATCDLDACNSYKSSVFNLGVHRQPEYYRRVAAERGPVYQPTVVKGPGRAALSPRR